MATNVEVERKEKENSMSVIKRFTRRVQESGVLQRVRSLRYAERAKSPYTKKTARLKSIKRKEEVMEGIKLGKITPGFRGRRHR